MNIKIIRAFVFILLLAFFASGCLWQRSPGNFPGGGYPWRSDSLPPEIQKWQNLGAKVNPLLREYYIANKSKCTFPYNDNEAEIDGFAEYAAKHGVHLKNGQIVDPWGDPVHFVIARDGDDTLRARGESQGFGDNQGMVIVALLIDNPSRVRPEHDVWAFQNGLADTKKQQPITNKIPVNKN